MYPVWSAAPLELTAVRILFCTTVLKKPALVLVRSLPG